MNTKIMYGIANKKTGKLLTYDISSNDGGDFCVDCQHTLSENGHNDWIVDKIEIAKSVLPNNTPWYNAGYNSPSNPFVNRVDEFEVVKLTITIERVES
jgi:hypothetical protein